MAKHGMAKKIVVIVYRYNFSNNHIFCNFLSILISWNDEDFKEYSFYIKILNILKIKYLIELDKYIW